MKRQEEEEEDKVVLESAFVFLSFFQVRSLVRAYWRRRLRLRLSVGVLLQLYFFLKFWSGHIIFVNVDGMQIIEGGYQHNFQFIIVNKNE